MQNQGLSHSSFWNGARFLKSRKYIYSITLLVFPGRNHFWRQIRQPVRILFLLAHPSLPGEGFHHRPQPSTEKTIWHNRVSGRNLRMYWSWCPISYIFSAHSKLHAHRAVHCRECVRIYLTRGLPGCRYFGSQGYKLQLPSGFCNLL